MECYRIDSADPYIPGVALTFEWDPRKDAENRRKHGVAFSEALTVFADPLGRIVEDPGHSEYEYRWTLLGLSGIQRFLAVMFTERGEDRVRIISARPATRRERNSYEETNP